MESINSNKAPVALGPYSQGVVFGGTVYVSGQLGINPISGELCSDGVAAQTEQALKNIEAILKAAGSDMSMLLKLTIFLSDINQFATVNDVMGRLLNEPFPARACIEASALPKRAAIEIDAIAGLP